jgi:tetratricopeptide (TPR) repeat protein
MSIKQKVLDLLDFARREEQTLIDGLTAEDRAFKGSFEQWSPKDMLAHLYAWKAHFVENLDRLNAGDTWERVTDGDAFNAATYEAHHNKTWDMVLDGWAQANAGMRERAEALSEDDLTDRERFPSLNGQPLWRSFAGNGITHTALHFGEFYAKRGEIDRANTLHLTMVDKLLALDDSDDWRGMTLYNLACHYAITGQPDAAISKLREALALNSGLVEWSKQDPDLNSLREMKAYQALYDAYPT